MQLDDLADDRQTRPEASMRAVDVEIERPAELLDDRHGAPARPPVQIARILGRPYAGEVGPWRAYLRVVSGQPG